MEKEYVKELDRAYLVLESARIDEDEYVLQMALRGRLPGILPLSVAGKDGKKSLRADVTACTSISSRFKSVELTGSDLRKILSAIRDTSRRMPGLLMSVQDLYLDPECIFLGPGGDEVLVCYVPHISDKEPDSIRLLSEFLLKKTDHSDQAAADLAYSLYDLVSSNSYVLSDVLQDLLKKFGPEGGYNTGQSSNRDSCHGGVQSVRQDPVRDSRDSPNDSGLSQQPRSFAPGWSSSSNYKSEFDEFSHSNVKKLPPPTGKRASGSRHSRKTSGSIHTKKSERSGTAIGKGSRRQRQGASWKRLLPAGVILTAAGILIAVFRMDLTQIGGMGFLCGALIWMVHSSLEKHANEGKNVWFDDDMESDDQFYQSLRKELYAVEDETPQGNDESRERYSTRDRYDSPQAFSSRDNMERTRLLRHPSQTPALISLKKDLCPDIILDRDYLILGKSRKQADIVLPGDTISRKHARIERRMDGYYVTDLFSTNGTFLDGHRLESGQAVAMKDGAQLTIASLPYRIRIPDM